MAQCWDVMSTSAWRILYKKVNKVFLIHILKCAILLSLNSRIFTQKDTRKGHFPQNLGISSISLSPRWHPADEWWIAPSCQPSLWTECCWVTFQSLWWKRITRVERSRKKKFIKVTGILNNARPTWGFSKTAHLNMLKVTWGTKTNSQRDQTPVMLTQYLFHSKPTGTVITRHTRSLMCGVSEYALQQPHVWYECVLQKPHV